MSSMEDYLEVTIKWAGGSTLNAGNEITDLLLHHLYYDLLSQPSRLISFCSVHDFLICDSFRTKDWTSLLFKC